MNEFPSPPRDDSNGRKDTNFFNRLWNSSIILILFVILFAGIGAYFLFKSHAATSTSTAPATPAATGALVCGNTAVLNGPSTAPSGAVVVPAGNNGSLNFSAGKTYYFATGVHTLASGQFGQIIPADNDVFIGAPGAIIDGQHANQSAFTQHASNVTIKYLTIRNFAGTQDQFIVNHDSGNGWVLANNTIGPNDDGAAIGLGNNQSITYNCVTHNGQYGINGYNANTQGGPTPGVVIDHNEFSTNDTMNYDQGGAGTQGCSGCAGGMKLWQDVGTKVTNNYIHDNHDPGIWADTLNVGVDMENNYISGNWNEGIFYEVSYNARINNNTFVNNGWVKGSQGNGGLAPAIYISESGWDSRVAGGSGFTNQEIAGNVLTNNWDGIVLWENSNRYCSNGLPTDQCTLVAPTTATVKTCAAKPPTGIEPNYNCRWRTQNTYVHNNVFNLTPSAITANPSPCTLSHQCGINSTISEYADQTYWPADTIPDQVALNQNNVFDYNTYNGPWQFDSDEQHSGGSSAFLTFANWQIRHTTGNQKNSAQDVHSTCSGCQ